MSEDGRQESDRKVAVFSEVPISPQVRFRPILGAGKGDWLTDSVGNDAGFNFTYGGDWFPIRPFIVSSELDWGEIGHASLFHARITTGVQWHRGEIYAGYDYLDVGNAQLDAWVAGLRLWFCIHSGWLNQEVLNHHGDSLL